MAERCECVEPRWLRIFERALWKALVLYANVLLLSVGIVHAESSATAVAVVFAFLALLDLIITPVRGCRCGT